MHKVVPEVLVVLVVVEVLVVHLTQEELQPHLDKDLLEDQITVEVHGKVLEAEVVLEKLVIQMVYH